MILAASLFAAFRFSSEKRESVRAVGDMAALLELLSSELALKASPLPELIDFAEQNSSGAAKRLLSNVLLQLSRLGEMTFSEIWTRGVQACCGQLLREDRDMLRSLGQVLGRLALREQLQALDHCTRIFRSRQEELRRSLPSTVRMVFGLCVSCGLLLSILLY